jgi:hypothetical protein
MMKQRLNWNTAKLADDKPFKRKENQTYGVYVIWRAIGLAFYGTDVGDQAIYVGQGDTPMRLAAHRNDPKILQHKGTGTILAAWAEVRETDADGIERYMADQWKPIEGSRHPDVTPTPVNAPRDYWP